MDEPIFINYNCDNCKHADKKITEEPCFICNPWCDKWEPKEKETSKNVKTTL